MSIEKMQLREFPLRGGFGILGISFATYIFRELFLAVSKLTKGWGGQPRMFVTLHFIFN